MVRRFLVVVIAAVALAGCGGSSRTATATVTTTTTTTATATGADGGASVTTGSQASSAGSGGPCDGNPCIGDWQKEAAAGGSVVQCNDGTWSHAGGLSGACSHHGGESAVQGTTSGVVQTTSPATSGPSYGVQDLPVQCGAGVAGSSGVTCAFAENAFYEYWQASGGDATAAVSITVWGSLGKQFYPLSCNAGDGVVDCTGTNSTGVSLDARFSQDAVSAYTSTEANAYSASGKLGPAP
jgi:hypothetical protein